MSDIIANALKRKQELLQELREIELFLKIAEKFGANLSGGASSDDADSRPARKRGRPDDFADLMENVIRDEWRPMSRPELVEELEKRGHEIPSDDKPRYLGTILWRNRKRFRNLPKFGYWLIDEPYGLAGYDPAHDTELQRVLDAEADLIGPMPDVPDEGE